MQISRFALALIASAGAAGSALAAVQDINGFYVNTNVWYDHTNASSFYQNIGGSGVTLPSPAGPSGSIAVNGLAGTHKFIENTPAADDGVGGSFANRHHMLFSTDGGATPYAFTGTESFCIGARVEMKTRGQNWASGANNNVEGGMFALTDQGGGWLAYQQVGMVANGTAWANDTFMSGGYQLFGEGGGAGPYTPFITDVLNGDGTRSGGYDITFVYQAPAAGLPSVSNPSYTRVMVTDINSGATRDTGWRALTDNLWAIDGATNLGFQFQNAKQQEVIDSYYEHTISNLKIIPAPGAAALLGLGGLFAGRRRRN